MVESGVARNMRLTGDIVYGAGGNVGGRSMHLALSSAQLAFCRRKPVRRTAHGYEASTEASSRSTVTCEKSEREHQVSCAKSALRRRSNVAGLLASTRAVAAPLDCLSAVRGLCRTLRVRPTRTSRTAPLTSTVGKTHPAQASVCLLASQDASRLRYFLAPP